MNKQCRFHDDFNEIILWITPIHYKPEYVKIVNLTYILNELQHTIKISSFSYTDFVLFQIKAPHEIRLLSFDKIHKLGAILYTFLDIYQLNEYAGFRRKNYLEVYASNPNDLPSVLMFNWIKFDNSFPNWIKAFWGKTMWIYRFKLDAMVTTIY